MPLLLKLGLLAITASAHVRSDQGLVGFTYMVPDGLLDRSEQAPNKKVDFHFDVYDSPSYKSVKLGEIIVHNVPGEAFTYEWIQDGVRFVPDELSGDYMSHTALELRDGWVKVPEKPFLHPVWIHDSKRQKKMGLRPLKELNIVTIRSNSFSGDAFVVDQTREILTVRDLTPVDMDCGEIEMSEADREKVKKKAPVYKIPIKELFDSDGHLKVHEKYGKGC